MIVVRFVTTESSIGFSIEKVSSLKLVKGELQELQNKAFLRQSLLNSHLVEYQKAFLVAEIGVYKVIWHNTYSQTKPRQLNYLLKLLEPVDEKVNKTDLRTILKTEELSGVEN